MTGDSMASAPASGRRPVAVFCRAVLFLILALACRGEPDPAGTLPVEGSLRPEGPSAEGPVAPPGSPIELFRPIDLAMAGDSIYIVDNGEDRVVVLDRDLEVLGFLGREGEGPGEYQQPVLVRRSPRGVLVADMGNSRFTEIDPSGAILRTFSAPTGLHSFGVDGAGDPVVPSRTGTHHFARVRESGMEELGQWPGGSSPPDADELFSIQAGFRDPRVAVTAGDTVHVFDESTAVLYKYAPDGERLASRSVPAVLRDSAIAARDRLVGGLSKQGLKVLSSPLSRGLSVVPDGRLLLLLPAGGTFALLIDPVTYRALRIEMPADSAARALFRNARAATVVDSVLYLVRDVSVYSFRLRAAA